MTATELMNNYPRPEPGEKPIPGKEFYRPLMELSAAFILLARYSEMQLLEVMTNFWFNHFNVFGPEAIGFYALPPYVLKTIRGNALGKFPKLVEETARSPAMLYYLDNYLSTKLITLRNNEKRGLNENYARELMELHTLSVSAGYTQQDIINAAKVLTGWSITRPREGRLEFRFYDNLHQGGKKFVFGKTFSGGGIKEGLDMIRYLSMRPETAHFIAQKLVSHFVSDAPPENLIINVQNRFLSTGGDIPSMLREIFLSPEFNRKRHFRAKIKFPLRYLTSALRATDAQILDPLPIVRPLNVLGQPLFQCHPPTGYSDDSEDVISAGAFISEGAVSRALAFNMLKGVSLDNARLNPNGLTGIELVESLMSKMLFLWDQKTYSVVRKTSSEGAFSFYDLIALILVTPDFLLY
jgi:uncharacterized protein (DUF1800 family)